jgi:hypothetical protein
MQQVVHHPCSDPPGGRMTSLIIIGIFVLYGIVQTYALCNMAGFYSRMEEDDPKNLFKE